MVVEKKVNNQMKIKKYREQAYMWVYSRSYITINVLKDVTPPRRYTISAPYILAICLKSNFTTPD